VVGDIGRLFSFEIVQRMNGYTWAPESGSDRSKVVWITRQYFLGKSLRYHDNTPVDNV
jgi:hypothetical protein